MKIHSLYQDLFLTDLKKDLHEAESEIMSQKQKYNGAIRDVSEMKREIASYQGIVRRYRKMVAELQRKTPTPSSTHNLVADVPPDPS